MWTMKMDLKIFSSRLMMRILKFIFSLKSLSLRGLTVGNVGSHQQQHHTKQSTSRMHNSHSSYPLVTNKGFSKHTTSHSTVAFGSAVSTAPPVIHTGTGTLTAARRSVIPSDGTLNVERMTTTTRQVSGRTDWAAKYLNTSTKYSK